MGANKRTMTAIKKRGDRKLVQKRMEAWLQQTPAHPTNTRCSRHSDVRPTVLELFAGAGGMSLGLEQAGFRHVLLVERDAECVRSLRSNGFRHVLCADAGIQSYSRYVGTDLVAGGPPCQPFSLAGKGEGSEDGRDGWPTVLRAVSEVKPKLFLFENVAGMMQQKFECYRNSLIRQFESMGFRVQLHVADAVDYGIPQYRKRVFMIGHRHDHHFKLPRKIPGKTTLHQMLTDLGPPNGRNGHVLHGSIPRPYGSRNGSRLHRPSRTLLAGTGSPAGGTNMFQQADGTYRYYTLREMARIQSFPDTYRLHPTWSRAARQMGNACPPKLAYLFACGFEMTITP